MKTVKAYAKRVKVTKNGKILTRKSGQNHFNSKENTKTKMHKKRDFVFNLTNKERSKFLLNITE